MSQLSTGIALVTGASGFVGAAVARALLARGVPVRTMVRENSDRSNIADLDVEIVHGDLLTGDGLADATTGCSSLFHVAADYRLWVPDPDVMYSVNVDGTGKLLRAAMDSGVERIVYTSSVSAVGIPSDGSPGDERTPVALEDMIGPYKRSKYLAEQLVRRMAEQDGCPVVIVNPSTPIGPGDVKPTPTGRVIDDAVHGRMPAFVDTGLNIVHVDDVAEGQLLAYERGQQGERYILGGEDLTLQELLACVAELVGRRPPKIRLPHQFALGVAYLSEAWARLSGTVPQVTLDGVRMSRHKMFFSSARAHAELGYEPRPAVEAIRDAVEWFRAR
ncbi:MAG: NAD-dependent epimerase/dehydratase family protein [Gammaproteobacteria bacterium]|nr:NAD-dependent epimerase/dehydratase family protein [Gammaproteobacteria bacterium]MBT8444248.1 NAD-dependent epimerase/dehydratase family protein [Gammaproteobacteria bacterium]NND37662.1 NAD-dependent epimerase/dehydratase family protein [Gammaproteobacteria bacterium]